jgi:hypothetical protein
MWICVQWQSKIFITGQEGAFSAANYGLKVRLCKNATT